MNKNKKLTMVAGGAGFIGSNLVASLCNDGHSVVVVDNFCRGNEQYLPAPANGIDIVVIKADLSDRDSCRGAFDQPEKLGCIEEVWHLAANSDIPAGVADSDVDIRDTFQTTAEILREMKLRKVKKLYFASSSAIYGDLGNTVLHEEIGPLLPISNYGAMKLASEALISAAAESSLDKACVFRFPNVVGVPATHGVIFDFINKLIANPESLEVLGDGSQQKSYLHASDLVSAMMTVVSRSDDPKLNVVNIGPTDEGVTVRWIAERVVERVSRGAAINYGTGNKGWVGDVPKFNYSTQKLQSYGWAPALGSDGAILKSVDEIATQLGR